ncbi:PAS domain S-box protein [Anaerobacillus sp. MEB173]|uniref:PAS domain-containing sensor histidine kinase n=1 Tax=Anaerobacillus sp. MEB173 TaxID=3383345 RepID=UPI003F924928
MESNLFNTMFNQSAIPMAIYELSGTHLYVNQSYCELIGYNKSELLTITPLVFIHPDDRETVLYKFNQLSKGDIKSFQNEIRYVHKQGHSVWVLINVNLIHDKQGLPVYVMAQMQNITTRKLLEVELLDNEERFRSLVVYSPEMICVHDGSKYLYINPSGAKLLGAQSPEEIIGQSVWRFFRKEEHEQRIKNMGKILQKKGEVDTIQHQMVKLDGTIIDVDVTATCILFNGKKAIQAIVKDVTERKKIEYLLRKSEKLSLVGQLAAGVAHEIRNPLTSVKGFIQLSQVTKEFNEDHSKIMIEELNRVESIIYEFLTLAKPNHDTIFTNKDLRKLLKQVITLLNTQASIRNIEIITELHDVPPIECEENSIKQVFINILQNAIESLHERGCVKIKLEQQQNNMQLIQIIDNGCGIPPDRLKRLGEPFYSSKEKGTGLGLMVSFKIIENHQGTIQISSEYGKGTTVNILLPQKQKVQP